MFRWPRQFLPLLLIASACGCGKTSATSSPRDAAAPPPPAAPASASIPSAAIGILRGKVFFKSDGPPPVMHDIDTKGLPACNHKICEEYALVNPNGTLKNVLVYLEGLPAADGASLPAAVINQIHCQYVPHVVALRVGQKLIVRSNDDTIHNVQGQPRANPAFNFSQTKVGAEHTLCFKAPEIFGLRCDVHPWMQAYVGVFDNGFFALTGDDGAFEITGIPCGQYTLIAWHEHFDKLSQTVTLSDEKPVQADFTYQP